MARLRFLCAVGVSAILCAACTSRQAETSHAPAGAEATSHTANLSNRIPVPESVRRNLGIRFVKVESRRVASTLRMPGRFEGLPSARREYRTPLAGRIELLASQYDRVTTGTPLYRLDSPQWHAMQQELVEAEVRVAQTSASAVQASAAMQNGTTAGGITRGRAIAGEKHLEALRESLRLAEERVAHLERVRQIAGGLASELAEARAQVAAARTALTEAEEEKAEVAQQRLLMATSGEGAFATSASLEAIAHARETEYEAARMRLRMARSAIRSVLQVPDEVLDEPTSTGRPLWQSLDAVELSATAPGVIEQVALASGAYAEAATLVMSSVEPEGVRFRATGLQSDLGAIQEGMKATIFPPRGGSIAREETVTGTLSLALESDPEERTMDLIVLPESVPAWARAGVTAFVEVEMEATEDSEPAVPQSAVVQDDLDMILFRRDPADPDKVIRLEADIGVSDGHWVTIQSGLAVGDEVVAEGAYQLRLAGSGKIPMGAHVDADGTVHFGKH